MNKRNITDFYEKDVPAFASYDNLRKINGIDGLRLSQRKIVWTAFKRCYNDWLKTDTMCAQTQIDTNYIHGAANLEIVIDNMAANYVGSNNYALLVGNSGGFGCRISPRPSAGRYTRVKLSEISKKLFLPIDNEILEKQFFEGQYIEPKFLVPVFPILFLNGSSGMSTGFSNSIYPRNPEEVVEYIKKKLSGVANPRMDLLPWFRGHTGKVVWNEELQRNESFGVYAKNNMNSYIVTELPIGTEYQKYIELLDKLEENGTIQGYDDKCDPKTDRILFEIKTTREFTRKHESERSVYEVFKLVKSLPETLCCIDENNRVREFSSVREILDAFIEIRLKYYKARKDHILKKLKGAITKNLSMYMFVKGVVDGTIKVAKKKKAEIEAQLEKTEKIVKVDGSYSYLLGMPIWSLTAEKMDELRAKVKDIKAEFEAVKATSPETMWTEDLKELRELF